MDASSRQGRNGVRNDASTTASPPSHVVHLSRKFVVFSVVLPVLLAFSVGFGARMLLENSGQLLPRAKSSGKRATSIQKQQEARRNGVAYLLYIDLKGLDSEFLQSEVALSEVMIMTAVSLKRGSRFSHYCNKHAKDGLTCVTALPKGGFISIHTQPSAGVAMMDVVLCVNKEKDMVKMVPEIKSLFQQRQADPNRALQDFWSVRVRGIDPEDFDSMLDEHCHVFKERHASVDTPFQTIDVYDFIHIQNDILFHRKMESLSSENAGSYAARFPHLFDPDRAVFLNSVIQSTRNGDAAYHEALVHPAMFAHDKPERVAIIGGGEGATLREVLKHNTVKQAIMVEIDGQMMQTSREILPEWNSCKDLVGSPDCCFDDPRADVYAEDALAWFIDRFYTDDENKTNPQGLENAEPIDVIIMDALDPADNAEFCEILYENDAFFKALYNALSIKGVLVMQLGEAPDGHDAPDTMSVHHLRASVVERLIDLGFESLHIYSEAHCGFEHPWTYMVVFKDWDTRAKWYANEAEINLELHKRSTATLSGQSPFRYFDGGTMLSYQRPHLTFQKAYCRREPMPLSCEPGRVGYDHNKPNLPIASVEVRKSGLGESAGRGLFAKVDIAEGSYIGAEQFSMSLTFPPSTNKLIMDLVDESDALVVVYYYVIGYGFEGADYGGITVTGNSGPMNFANHGCNGTYNLGNLAATHTSNLTEWATTEERQTSTTEEFFELYNPAWDRNIRLAMTGSDGALRAIRAGEEILDNYLEADTGTKEWTDYVKELQSQCRGESLGEVSEYENMDTT